MKKTRPKPVSEKTRGHSAAEVLSQVPTQKKLIALTFDDGPDPVFTRKVLKILKKRNASATFFLIGHHIENYPDIAAEIFRSGNELGVHSYDHKSLIRLSYHEVLNQVHKTYELIYRSTGIKPVLFRPPFGFYNANVLNVANEKKLKVILWTPGADPKDFKNPGTDKIVQQLVKNAKPGMIVLLHDNGRDRQQTVAAIDRMMTILASKGYRFQTVSSMLSTAQK